MHVHETMVVAVHVGFVYQQLAVATNVYNQVADEQAPFINHFNNVKSCKINVKNYKILNVVDTEIIKRFQVCYCIICRRPGVSLRLAFTCRFNVASKLVVTKLPEYSGGSRGGSVGSLAPLIPHPRFEISYKNEIIWSQ